LTIKAGKFLIKGKWLSADGKIMLVWMVTLLMQAPPMAAPLMQTSRSQADRIRAAMAKSLASQQESVRRQIESAGPDRKFFSAAPLAAAICDAIVQPDLGRMIDVAAQRENLDPGLVREVARQESGFRPCAVSSKGAQGLMQLMPATQIQLQVQNPFSAQQSLEAGSKLLKQLLDRYHGDVSLALSAYNAGPARVDVAGGVPKIPETQNYVSTIMKRLLPVLGVGDSDSLDPAP
jgi:soluble lytic murein transglycosylase-like protein